MRAASFRLAVATTVVATLLARSASGTSPPLEQLGLRDALLARPEVIAALLPAAHQQLAQRFEDARRHPGNPQEPVVATAFTPVDEVRAVDEGRLGRGRDALIAGQLQLTAAGLEVPFFSAEVADGPAPLPPLEGVPAGATAEDEAIALRGTAGAVLRGLLDQSGASRLVRVVSWPVAAVAIKEAVYVNAAWLMAMAPLPTHGADPTPKSAGSPTEAGLRRLGGRELPG